MAWQEIVKAVAPKLGAALGGPMGGIATKFIADKFLGNPDASEEELELAISGATPQDLTRLKEIESQYEIEVLKIAAQDRDSARNLAIETGKTPQIILSSAYTIGYFAIFMGMLGSYFTIPEEQESLFLTLFGSLTAAQLQIMNFWFGSSSGSKDKNK